jgi:hypothetical protein
MVRFVTPDDVAYSTDQPVVQAAFRFLAKIHPAVVPFETLYAEAARAVHGTASPPPREADALASVLLRNFFYSRSLVELYVAPRHVENHVTVRPQATVFARWLAAQGAEKVPNARHEQVQLSEIARTLVPLLDGEHDVAALVAAGQAALPGAGRKLVEDELRWLARVAMLVA